jgi:hypothetical protein
MVRISPSLNAASLDDKLACAPTWMPIVDRSGCFSAPECNMLGTDHAQTRAFLDDNVMRAVPDAASVLAEF